MSTLNFVLVTKNLNLQKKFDQTEVIIQSEWLPHSYRDSIVAADVDLISASNSPALEAKKLMLVTSDHSKIPGSFLEKNRPDQLIHQNEFDYKNYLMAKEKLNQKEQDQVYLNLASELNQEYEILKKELENKITAHQTHLIENRQKLLESNNRSESLRKILFALHQEGDISRIETLLNELLPSAAQINWVKIVQASQKELFESDLKGQLDMNYTTIQVKKYIVYFFRGDKKTFKKSDLDLIQKIADVLNLNIERAENLQDLILAEKILNTAFDSFAYPLALIDKNYRIINANQKFSTAQSNLTAKNQICYQYFFGRSSPCENCQLGQKFVMEHQGQSFEVDSKIYQKNESEASIWVNTYKDVTEKLLLEQRITQTAKMNDLGLISSSIAHELNNPLGGIISYLQMMQLDLEKADPIQTDLQEMLNASLRIKKIIEDLLIFSRRPQIQNIETVPIKDLLAEVISINELALKTENIKISNEYQKIQQTLSVSKAAFKDSLHFILIFFLERARTVRKNKPQHIGLIEIKYTEENLKNKLLFMGNFGPLETDVKLKNVQMLAIHKTLVDQGFHVELVETSKTWVGVEITFQKS